MKGCENVKETLSRLFVTARAEGNTDREEKEQKILNARRNKKHFCPILWAALNMYMGKKYLLLISYSEGETSKPFKRNVPS